MSDSDGDSMKVERTGIGNIDHKNSSEACDDRVIFSLTIVKCLSADNHDLLSRFL